MGNPGRPQGKESPSVQSSPRTSPSGNSNNNGGSGGGGGGGGSVAAPPVPPLTPKIIPRSETNAYPTTFVQADTSSFKQVVQMLTGSTETATAAAAASSRAAAEAPSPRGPIPLAKTGPKRPAFKLYERRHNSFRNLRINPLVPDLIHGATAGFSPRKQQPEILSPSVLDFPSLVLSPVTPLIPDPFNRPPHPSSPAGKLAEERAIAGKGFYLHPSPRGNADAPKLLPLFPVTSPGASSAASQ